MSVLDPIVMGRDLDFEGARKLINVGGMTLATAATAANEPLRKGEFDTSVSGLQSSINALDAALLNKCKVVRDSTHTDLAGVLAAGSFAAGKWTIDGHILDEGDLIIIVNATDPVHRSWVMNGGTAGTAADFDYFGGDISALITAAKATLVGDATVYTNLGAVEDKLDAVDTALALKAVSKVYSNKTFTEAGGIYSMGINTSTDFGTPYMNVSAFKPLSGGAFQELNDDEFIVTCTASTITLRTMSGTVGAMTLDVVVQGLKV